MTTTSSAPGRKGDAPWVRPPSEWLIGVFAILTLAAGVLLFAEDYVFGIAAATDTLLLTGLRQAAEHPGAGWALLRRVLPVVTEAGAFPTLVLVLGVVAIFLIGRGHRAMAFRLAATTGLGMGAANLLKMVVERPRPEIVTHWAAVGSLSFPSGHAADSAVVYLTLALLADCGPNSPTIGYTATVAAIAVVVLVGSSRLYLGVHWPTDVLAGWCFGATWVCATGPWLRGSTKASLRMR